MSEKKASATLIKKIATRNVVGGVGVIKELAKRGDGDTVMVMRVKGLVSGVRSGESTHGDFTALKGRFEATNLATGEAFRAPECFLPDVVNSEVVGAFNDLEEGELIFAVDIGVKYMGEDATGTGYEYTAAPLTEVGEADPFAALGDLPPAPALPRPPLTDADDKPAKGATKAAGAKAAK